MIHDDPRPASDSHRRRFYTLAVLLFVGFNYLLMALALWGTQDGEPWRQQLQGLEGELAEAQKQLDSIERNLAGLDNRVQAAYWSRPLTAEQLRQYQSVEIVHRFEGEEYQILSFRLDSKSNETARAAVSIQKFPNQKARVTLSIVRGENKITRRGAFQRGFKHISSTHGFGVRDNPWREETLLMSGGENGAGSEAGHPPNKEEVFLRLVKRKKQPARSATQNSNPSSVESRDT